MLVSVVVANHTALTDLQSPTYAWPKMGLTLLMGVLMISNVRFRSFKQFKLDLPTILLILFVVGSSAGVVAQFGPGVLLVWWATVYVSMGLIESVVSLPKRIRARRKSIPPS